MAKDVLEVLRRLDNALLSRRATPQECVALNEAVEAVTDLIAADVEYNAAKAEYEKQENADDDDDLYLNALKRLQWATDRRVDALVACRGL